MNNVAQQNEAERQAGRIANRAISRLCSFENYDRGFDAGEWSDAAADRQREETQEAIYRRVAEHFGVSVAFVRSASSAHQHATWEMAVAGLIPIQA